jgi:hypothetical protein
MHSLAKRLTPLIIEGKMADQEEIRYQTVSTGIKDET